VGHLCLPWPGAAKGDWPRSNPCAKASIQLAARARYELSALTLLMGAPPDHCRELGGSVFFPRAGEVGGSNSTSVCSNQRVVDRLACQNRRTTPPTNPIAISPRTIQTVSTKKTQTISLGTSKKITATQINAPPKTMVERSRFIMGLTRELSRYASIFAK